MSAPFSSESLTISVVMPVYNGESTLNKTVESLISQHHDFEELIIINDNSQDNSETLLRNLLSQQNWSWQIINHQQTQGLAKSYNEAIKLARGKLIVTVHQDVVLLPDALKLLKQPFLQEGVVASTHGVLHPKEVWDTYNFWQKTYFARSLGKTYYGIDGKLDCFLKSALMQVGLFDEQHFHSAGEDGDLVFKLKQVGHIAKTEAKIIHLHKCDDHFKWQDILFKQAQYSEAQGVLFRLGRITGLLHFAQAFFREILLLSLLIPFLNYLAACLISLYLVIYSRTMFIYEYKNWRIVLIPLLNLILLPVSFVFSLRGIWYGRQRL